MVLASTPPPFDPIEYPNCFRGHVYAQDVVSGKKLANKFVTGACKRYLRDVQSVNDDWYFSPERAEKFLRLGQKFHHVIGEWPTKNIVFEPWQCWVGMNIFGFRMRATHYRRFRVVHLDVPRGNAKSTMASIISLYIAFMDGGQGNQVATAATKREQARIVLDAAMEMARKNPGFCSKFEVKVYAHTIRQKSTNSIIRSLSSDSTGQDGLNDVAVVLDELHAMKRAMYEVLTSGMSKRSDSLILCITTAGFDVTSVGYSQSMYARKVCLGEVQGASYDQMFAAVYCPDEEDDLFDEKTWIKSNPNWGVSVDPSSFRAKFEKALDTPADLPGLKVKHLNLWSSEAQAHFNLEKWDVCETTLDPRDLERKECYLGLDLASKIDLTSYVSCFYIDEKYILVDRNFLPQETFDAAKNDLYRKSQSEGSLIVTPGAAINNNMIREDIEDFSTKHRVIECYYDPWNATEMSQNLANKIEMVEFRMNVANFSEPLKSFDALIRKGKVLHFGSPIFRWCLGNVVVKEDHNGNIFPRKTHAKLKIDTAIAGTMALAGWLQKGQIKSVYEERGIRTLRIRRP